MRRENVLGKYNLLNGTKQWHSCSGVPRVYVNIVPLWPLKRDYHSGVLIGVGGTRRTDWTARVLANDVSTGIDRKSTREERSIARVVASCYSSQNMVNECLGVSIAIFGCLHGTYCS